LVFADAVVEGVRTGAAQRDESAARLESDEIALAAGDAGLEEPRRRGDDANAALDEVLLAAGADAGAEEVLKLTGDHSGKLGGGSAARRLGGSAARRPRSG